MKSRTFAWCLVAVATVALVVPSFGQSKNRLDALMARKLISSQKVLEGVATANYEMIRREARQLHLFSQEAGWQVLQTRDYARLSTEFRKATEQLQDSAEKENLDAAGLAYIKLIITCIDCHRHVRSDRRLKAIETQNDDTATQLQQ